MLLNFFSKKPSFYSTKDDYYKTITTETTFLKIIASNLDFVKNHSYKTEKQILFNNKLTLDSTHKEIIDQLGKPLYQVQKNPSLKHNVLFYKKKIGTYNIRLEIHVVNKKYLIGFINFNISSTTEKMDVIKLICNKYDINHEIEHLKDFRIYNDKNEYIKIIDSIDITLVYGSNSEQTNKIITKLSDEKELKNVSQSRKNKMAVYENI